MKKITKFTQALIITLIILLSFSTLPSLAKSNSFSDDFNRPDGLIDNGWTSWWGYSLDDPTTMIVNGELRTLGFPEQAGGIFRTHPVSFPVKFSFDFRTDSLKDVECATSSFNDGGWRITINAAASPTPYKAVAQVKFEQYAGSRNMIRRYLTDPGVVDESGMAEDVAPIVTGQRDFNQIPTHIEGKVFPDLSAEFKITYSDGQSPKNVMVSFGPAADAIDYQPGSILAISNSNCSTGPHYIDNFEIK